MTRKPMTLREAGLAIVRRLRQHGHQALWAGGCVRDMLLNKPPMDIDVATDAPPERIIDLFSRTRHVGVQFGVVLVRQGPFWIETATFRTDVDYQDGRRPDKVVFTSAEEDAQRRDFTINGLFYDPIDDRVIDHVGGQEDLRAGLIRAIGEPAARFAEDHLRMLRAVRFATRLGFTLEPRTAAAIRLHAASITRISTERIREELEKMLSHPARAEAFELIADFGLLAHIWPGANWPTEQIRAAVARLARLPDDAGFPLAMAAVLFEFSARGAADVGRALRCSNEQIEAIRWLVEHGRQLDEAADLSLAAFKRLAAHPGFGDLLALHRAWCLSMGRPVKSNEAARRRRDAISPDQLAPPPLVTGEDLIALGLEPGPRFKILLDQLYDAQLNMELTTRDAALARLGDIIHEL